MKVLVETPNFTIVHKTGCPGDDDGSVVLYRKRKDYFGNTYWHEVYTLSNSRSSRSDIDDHEVYTLSNSRSSRSDIDDAIFEIIAAKTQTIELLQTALLKLANEASGFRSQADILAVRIEETRNVLEETK